MTDVPSTAHVGTAPRLSWSSAARLAFCRQRPTAELRSAGQPGAAVPTWSVPLASSRLIFRCPSRFRTFGAGLRGAPSASCWWWRRSISTPVTRVENALKEVPAKIGIEIQQSAKGFTVSRSEQGHTIFKIEASKAVQYKQGGHAELHDVTITLYGRDSSRFDQIYGADFEYDPQSGDVIGKGQVQMDLEANPEGIIHPDQATPRELKNPVHLTTTNLFFNQKTGNALTREKVEFSLPQANGSAVGLSYAANTTVLTLQSQVDVAFHGATPARLTAIHGTITKNPRVVELDLPRLQNGARPRFRGQRHDLPASRTTRWSAFSPTATFGSNPRTQGRRKFSPTRWNCSWRRSRTRSRSATFSGDVRMENSGPQPMQGSAGRVVLNFTGNNVLKHRAQPGQRQAAAASEAGIGVRRRAGCRSDGVGYRLRRSRWPASAARRHLRSGPDRSATGPGHRAADAGDGGQVPGAVR